MANEHTEFWTALLKFGDTEEERRRNWNKYCNWKFGEFFDWFVPFEGQRNIAKDLNLEGTSGNDQGAFDELANAHGGHPQLPEGRVSSIQALIDFSGLEFEEHMYFKGNYVGKCQRGLSPAGPHSEYRRAGTERQPLPQT